MGFLIPCWQTYWSHFSNLFAQVQRCSTKSTINKCTINLPDIHQPRFTLWLPHSISNSTKMCMKSTDSQIQGQILFLWEKPNFSPGGCEVEGCCVALWWIPDDQVAETSTYSNWPFYVQQVKCINNFFNVLHQCGLNIEK